MRKSSFYNMFLNDAIDLIDYMLCICIVKISKGLLDLMALISYFSLKNGMDAWSCILDLVGYIQIDDR